MLSITLSSIPVLVAIMYLETCRPVVKLPPLTIRDILNGIKCTFIYGFVLGSFFMYTIYYLFSGKTTSFSICKIILNIILADLAYYLVHRFLFHSKSKYVILKYFHNSHKIHHVVKSLDFIRGNDASIFDAALVGFQLFNAIFGVILSMDFISIYISNMIILLMQLAHHTNYTFDIGFLKVIFVDSHCHKLHHCIDGYNINYGGILSIWDKIFLTFHENSAICTNYYHHTKKLIFKKN